MAGPSNALAPCPTAASTSYGNSLLHFGPVIRRANTLIISHRRSGARMLGSAEARSSCPPQPGQRSMLRPPVCPLALQARQDGIWGGSIREGPSGRKVSGPSCPSTPGQTRIAVDEDEHG